MNYHIQLVQGFLPSTVDSTCGFANDVFSTLSLTMTKPSSLASKARVFKRSSWCPAWTTHNNNFWWKLKRGGGEYYAEIQYEDIPRKDAKALILNQKKLLWCCECLMIFTMIFFKSHWRKNQNHHRRKLLIKNVFLLFCTVPWTARQTLSPVGIRWKCWTSDGPHTVPWWAVCFIKRPQKVQIAWKSWWKEW